VGDGGLSLGPYQISKSYWEDAIEHRPSIGGRYEDVRKFEYAEEIICAYWDRWCRDGSWEVRARVHNGGPMGARKTSTEGYWEAVSSRLQR
tara:strand:+ start:295 stop:567 length:273 start_codon:yes stop_codon:yes gene_type:complete